jgi:hypothetical protein
MTVAVFRLWFGVGTIEDAIGDMHNMGRVLAWFVSPAIGYYFGKDGSQ